MKTKIPNTLLVWKQIDDEPGGNEVMEERSKEKRYRARSAASSPQPDTLAAFTTLHLDANSSLVPGEACSTTRARI